MILGHMPTANAASPQGSGDRPLLSVGVFTYNHSKYVNDSLSSLAEAIEKSQISEHCEVLILDDASCDGTLLDIESFLMSREDLDFQLLLADKNNGFALQLNRFLAKASGDYLLVLSGDDIVTANGMRALLRICEARSNVDVIFGYVVHFEGKGPSSTSSRRFMAHRRWLARNFGNGSPPGAKLWTLGNFIPGGGTIFKSDALSAEGFTFLEELSHAEDYDLWLALRNRTFLYIDAPFLLYRRHMQAKSLGNDHQVLESYWKIFLRDEARFPARKFKIARDLGMVRLSVEYLLFRLRPRDAYWEICRRRTHYLALLRPLTLISSIRLLPRKALKRLGV